MTRAILLFGREQLRLLIFAGSNVMKTIYLMMGLVMMVELSGCARPIMESNYQKTQPLLTQMLCPTCDVPSLQPPTPQVAKAAQPIDSTSKTITTTDNPAPASETSSDSSETTAAAPTPVDTAPQPVAPTPVSAPPSTPAKPRVITLDLNAPDLGIHETPPAQTAPAAPVPPQSKVDTLEKPSKKTPSSHIQLSEADIHNAQDVHELTVRLMHLNQ
jgi:hypothetical protein